VSPEQIDILVAKGASVEMIAELWKAQIATEAQATEGRRSKDRERQRRHRESRDVTVTGRDMNGHDVTLSPQLPPLKSTPDPEKIPPPLTPQSGDLSAEPTDPPLTESEILEAWEVRMVPQGFPAVRKMTGQRKRQLQARLRDSTFDEWQQAMGALERSAFCRGENDRGWRADFDFLLQPKSFTKLLEGAYDH
jgi:hypothetical protein